MNKVTKDNYKSQIDAYNSTPNTSNMRTNMSTLYLNLNHIGSLAELMLFEKGFNDYAFGKNVIITKHVVNEHIIKYTLSQV